MRAVLYDLGLHTALFALLVVAGAVLTRRVSAHPAALAAGGLALFGVTNYAVGIVWYAAPRAGQWASRTVPVICLLLMLWEVARRRREFVEVVRKVGLPLVLTALYAALVLGLGFLYGGYEKPLDTPAVRFSSRLPIDNQLPYLMARHVEQFGHSVPVPPVGDWLASDRSPLQSAVWLGQTLWHRGDASAATDYQVLGTVMQSSWVLGVWALLSALAVRRVTVALSLAAVGGCGVVVLNTFFVWPKMLAATFVLACAALVLARDHRWPALRIAAVAVTACLAYLSHGGAVFVLVPVVALALVQALHNRRRLTVLAAAAASALALVLPWTLYQRLVNPPGDRLLKWMLAGVIPVDPRSPVTAIVDQYRAAGWSGALSNKWHNILQIVGGRPPIPAFGDASWYQDFVSAVRAQNFFSLLPSAGLLLVLALGWAYPRRAHLADRRAATWLLLVAAVSSLFWCVAMFGPGTTVTHQGTYALVVLMVCALTCAGAAQSTRATAFVVAVAGIVSLLLYVPQYPISGFPWTDAPKVHATSAVVLVCGLIGFVALLWGYALRPEEHHRHRAQSVITKEIEDGAVA